jgi:predicted outer membrane repeat protein
MQSIPNTTRWIFYVILLAGLCNITLADSLPGYTIITTTEIQNTSQKLLDFITHKESLGFNVLVVTETDFGGGIGDEAAGNIRAWLQNNYISDNIKYVLLIGDPRTDNSEIPMKMFFPLGYDPNNPNVGSPSDFFYADLSGNWDLDGDGYPGEWKDDFGIGGIDRECEVLVGRIPYYPDYDEPNDLDEILSKIIHYENQNGEQILWRKSALLAMNLGNDSCRLGEKITHDILIPAEWSFHRVYYEIVIEDCNPESPPETILPDLTCFDGLIPQIWGEGKYGLVVWAADADPDWVGCIIHISHVSKLNNEYPSFTFQVSCHTGKPEERNNLAYALLKHGAICNVATTREAWGALWYPFSAAGMAYEYTSRIVAGLTSGEALYALKEEISLPHDARGYWPNFLNYNIYGDPSIILVPLEDHIIYVDDDATGANDGTSWVDAYNYLQDALADANNSRKPLEIRVTQGTYRPDQGARQTPSDREATFQLINGVTLAGGYAGAADPNARDIELYETILSGDLNSDDVDVNDPGDLYFEPTRAENSYHVVTGSGADETTVLDGFTITAGNANGPWEPYHDHGGGMFNNRGNPKVANCTFTGNSASWGSGMYNGDSNPTLSNCTFSENSAGWEGGGMYNDDHSSPILTDCTFRQNSAGQSGGGMYNRWSSPILTNCIFSGNLAGDAGGGMYSRDSQPILTNCTLSNNSANTNGGGTFCTDQSTVEIRGCTFTNNSSGSGYSGGGLAFESLCTMLIKDCNFMENNANSGGAIYGRDRSDVTIEDCQIEGNISGVGSGGIRLSECYKVLVSDCIIKQNSANSFCGLGGGIFLEDCLDAAIVNCTITENVANQAGGGIVCKSGHQNNKNFITNCVIAGNSSVWPDSGYGGGIALNTIDNTVVRNCTIVGNYAKTGGGISSAGYNSATIKNCLLWDNTADRGPEISVTGCHAGYGPFSVEFNAIHGTYDDVYITDDCTMVWGPGNIHDFTPDFAIPGYWVDVNDPNIVVYPDDSNAVWVDGDYHLKSQAGRFDPNSGSWVVDDVTSPCIDTGDPNSDWSNETWPHGGRINMGAYGGTREASMSLETEGMSLPRVAFIYLDDDETAESFKSLLESYGCPTTLIKTKNVTATLLDSCDLVIVANDTFRSHAWTEPNATAAIEYSGKPIIGLGEGGYDFFGMLGLSIGSPYGSTSSHNSISVIDPAHSLLSTPYPIDIPQDGMLQLYKETRDVALYFWPDIPETVTVLAVLHNEPGYYPLAMEHNRYFLWGFIESPDKMTDIGRKLFINTVIWMANANWENEN